MPAMEHTHLARRWLGRFAVRFMQLRHEVPLHQAAHRAVSAQTYADHLLPELDATVPHWRVPTRLVLAAAN
jgi:hypothetical protein